MLKPESGNKGSVVLMGAEGIGLWSKDPHSNIKITLGFRSEVFVTSHYG